MLLNDPAHVYRTMAKIAFVDHGLNFSSHYFNFKKNVVEQTGELAITTIS